MLDNLTELARADSGRGLLLIAAAAAVGAVLWFLARDLWQGPVVRRLDRIAAALERRGRDPTP